MAIKTLVITVFAFFFSFFSVCADMVAFDSEKRLAYPELFEKKHCEVGYSDNVTMESKKSVLSSWNDMSFDEAKRLSALAYCFLQYQVAPACNPSDTKFENGYCPILDFPSRCSPNFTVNGHIFTNVVAKVFPFKINHPRTKETLYCCLVSFFVQSGYVCSVYVSGNTGKTGLDFQSLDDISMLTAAKPRFHLLSAAEKELQMPLANSYRKAAEKRCCSGKHAVEL